MNDIRYIKGDATQPQAEGTKIIVHICNDIGGWGKGFVLAISKRWRAPEQAYRTWYQERAENNFELGNIQLVQVEEDLYIANMVGQKGIKKTKEGVPIRYEAVKQCLEKVAQKALQLNASVHMPRIGCGLAGGTWDKIGPIVKQTLVDHGIETVVYDFM